MAAIYAPPPEIADGFDAEDYEVEVEIWPENVRSFNFFSDMCGTQWRVGNSGLIGLDYGSILSCIRLLRLPRAEADQLFSDVRVMEKAAISAARG